VRPTADPGELRQDSPAPTGHHPFLSRPDLLAAARATVVDEE